MKGTNTMKKTVILTALALGASALCATAQEAGGPPHAPQGQPGGPGGVRRPQPAMHQKMQAPRMSPERLKHLGATDAQLEALEKIHFDAKEKSIDLRANVEKAQLALDRLLQNDTSDESATMKAVDALNQARSEMFKQHVATQLKVKQTLGAELLKKLHQPQRPPGPPPGEEPNE
jgi:Spy/CpxP family protein refolding chaperone